MEWFWIIVLGIVGYWLGMLAASWPTTQIGCALFCAFPLLRKLQGYEDCFDLRGCRSLFTYTIVLNAFILALAIWAVVTWAPDSMVIGFWIGYCFTILLGCKKWGISQSSVADFLDTLDKFVITEEREKVIQAVEDALQ